ncbi:L-asparaginase [Weissella uvarum]|uniref:asparaginase n=1 Tax=Weissella uvarum TaxID=1479233 RepID=UPI001962249B|nr:asparaginase [Weissella uvarum]MBM7616891.1 L-asparaginase [Weissella uvarum]MCM0594657.1 asparaginase [Weissella uvarum]
MQKILVLTTGGTIASHKTENGLAPGMADDVLLSYFDVPAEVQLSAESVMNKDSTNMQPEDWVTLADRIRNDQDDYDAFIITHGTDTMGYTAAGLSYLLNGIDCPVVLTGSQVPLGMDETDAVRNLNDALTFAIKTPLNGVYVVFNGVVIAGTRAIKTKTKSYDAFESVNFPYIAQVQDGELFNLFEPDPNDKVMPSELKLDTNVFVLKAFPGLQPEIIDYLGEHIDGLIIESFGNGGLPFENRNLVPGIARLTDAGIPVIITTQILQEGQDIYLYEVGQQVAQAGGISVGDMNTEAVVAKLMWVLAQTKNMDTIKVMMQKPIAHDLDFV